MTFTFNEEKHEYKLDGKRLTGVTTILGVLNKPALVAWSANQAVDYIENNFPTVEQIMSGEVKLKDLFKEARKAWAQKRDKAGDIGTDVHKGVEDYINLMISDQDGKAKEINGGHENELVQKFIDWAAENEITFVRSEVQVYSREHWYAGTCDLVFKDKDDNLWIGDIKTAKAIYGTEFWQTAGYQIALEEMGVVSSRVHGHKIIRIGKDGSFETKDRINGANEQDKDAFLSCLNIYRIKATLPKVKYK